MGPAGLEPAPPRLGVAVRAVRQGPQPHVSQHFLVGPIRQSPSVPAHLAVNLAVKTEPSAAECERYRRGSPTIAAAGPGGYGTLVTEEVPGKMVIGDLREDLSSGGTRERNEGLCNLFLLGGAI